MFHWRLSKVSLSASILVVISMVFSSSLILVCLFQLIEMNIEIIVVITMISSIFLKLMSIGTGSLTYKHGQLLETK